MPPGNCIDMALDRNSTRYSPPGPAALKSAPVEAQALAELRSNFDEENSALFNELLALFISELDPRLDAIRDAIERADQKAISAAAHALKGSSALVGARTMAELCLQIEIASRSGAMAKARMVLTGLVNEAERVRQALRAVLNSAQRR